MLLEEGGRSFFRSNEADKINLAWQRLEKRRKTLPPRSLSHGQYNAIAKGITFFHLTYFFKSLKAIIKTDRLQMNLVVISFSQKTNKQEKLIM